MASNVMDETTITLNNGVKVPVFGIGTQPMGGYSNEAVVCALKECGIRHIDTARMYQSEPMVAKSIKDSGIARKEVFITSKVWPLQYGYDEVKKAVKKSLKKLCTDYVDLYLLHWPVCPKGTENPKQLLAESWQALEECYQQGLCKAIGVSNFEQNHLTDLKETWTVVPQMNQIEAHVHMYPKKLVSFCQDLGIAITAHSTLTRGKGLKQPDVIRIAEELKCPVSHVLIKWAIQKGFVSIPKTTKPDRVREMATVFQCKLSSDHMEKLDEIHKHEFIQTCFGTQDMVHEDGKELLTEAD